MPFAFVSLWQECHKIPLEVSVLLMFVDIHQKRVLDHKDLAILAAEEKRKYEEKNRVKTAPARERRRNWLAGSVNIKTERGERCRLKAPGMMLIGQCFSNCNVNECNFIWRIFHFSLKSVHVEASFWSISNCILDDKALEMVHFMRYTVEVGIFYIVICSSFQKL